jgi:hypothetical protein
MKLIIIILALFPELVNAPAQRIMTWAVKESSVNIQGSSNVNRFSFSARNCEGKDTLEVYENIKGQKLIFSKGLFRLPVKKFRNGNPMLVRDFKKMLDCRNYPDILMNFQSITALAEGSTQHLAATAELEITLAGKTINRQVQVQTSRTGEYMLLTGCERLRFSDFTLKPPTGVMGFIDVRNELDIEFRFVLKVVNEGTL